MGMGKEFLETSKRQSGGFRKQQTKGISMHSRPSLSFIRALFV
jgi:hypothetical protein